MKTLLKAYWFLIMVLCIPLDILFWNLIFGSVYGFLSFKQSIKDNWTQWKGLYNAPQR